MRHRGQKPARIISFLERLDQARGVIEECIAMEKHAKAERTTAAKAGDIYNAHRWNRYAICAHEMALDAVAGKERPDHDYPNPSERGLRLLRA